MTRFAVLLPLLLAGCAGSVFSEAGATRAGSGLGKLERVPGQPCPGATFQGSIDVASLSVTCEDGQHRETFTLGGVNASTALASALQAQAQMTAALTGLLGQLLHILMQGMTGMPLPKPPAKPAVSVDLGAVGGP